MAPLGDHNDAVMLAVIVVVLQQRAHVINIDVAFRDQDDMGTAGNTGGIGDPTRITAHDFNNNYTVMRVGSGVNAIDCLRGDRYSSVETKGCVGPVDVVINGLGNANAGHTVLAQEQGHRLRIVAPEGDQRINPVDLQDLLDLFNAARNLLHVGARRMQNGAPFQLDAIDFFQSKGNEIVVQDAAPAVQKADEFIAIVVDALFHSRVDHRI